MNVLHRLLNNLFPRIPITLSPDIPPVDLPEDILRLIVQCYVESVLSKVNTIRELRKGRKAYWTAIAPLARTSTGLRKIVIAIWQTKWAICCSKTCSYHVQCHGGRLPPGVRILTIDDDWNPENLNLDLPVLKKLEHLSVDYHKLLSYNRSLRQLQVLPGVRSLPFSLRRLEILHFHGPIENFLPLVKSCCPRLVELRLVLCTMFNNPGCVWWRVNSHAHYLKGHRRDIVLEDTAILANHLDGLQLQHFHINYYFIDSVSVFEHRLNHKQYHPRGHHDYTDPLYGMRVHSPLHLAAQASDDAPPIDPSIPRLADKKLWAVSCPQCRRELEAPIQSAERLAASLLSARYTSLKTISFGDFLSQGRTEPSEWMVMRECMGERLAVWTQRPGAGQSWQRLEFEGRDQGSQWNLLE
ncbi:unnamed protein product [Rhizoctonia solani]|uniref:Uncharacterized protein n=1 Tax=Rhizoctonia solani TaxID=456999 RepID=A0A8H2XAZ7_9AGAM|nr:unnamed protein product [Rhizoctonia solani]